MRKAKTSSSHLSKDFEKRKASLKKQTTNRKSQPASNSTNTSFKARSISIPSQKVDRVYEDAPVRRGNLSLDELVLHLRHPNAHVRREALIGIRQIRQAHVKTFGDESFSQALPSVARVASDEDAGVRKVLLEVLEDCLSTISHRCLQPYAAYVLLQVNAAMSHIFPDVRIDAVRALDICITKYKSEAVDGWQRIALEVPGSPSHRTASTSGNVELRTAGARAMRCYLSLLGVNLFTLENHGMAKGRARTSHDLSGSSLLIVLSSLNNFLESAAQVETQRKSGDGAREGYSEEALSFMLPFLAHVSDKEALRKLLSNADAPRSSGMEDRDEGKSLFLAHRLATSSAHVAQTFTEQYMTSKESTIHTSDQLLHGEEDGFATERLALFEAIAVVLESSFVEAAASIAAEGGAIGKVPQRMVGIVLSLTLKLWRNPRLVSGPQLASLQRILSRVAISFPFGKEENASQDDIAAHKHWLDCNLAFCELACIESELSRGQYVKPRSRLPVSYLKSVGEYVEILLRSQQSRPTLRKERYKAILPSIWMLLNAIEEDDHRNVIVRGLLDHWSSLSKMDETKSVSTTFIAALLQIERFASYQGRLKMMASPQRRAMIVEWLGTQIPRQIWELRCSNLEMTDVVLRCLTAALLTKEDAHGNEWVSEVINILQSSLAPFFRIFHRKHGLIEGPYTRLPRHIQQQALALTHSMAGRLQAPLLHAVESYR